MEKRFYALLLYIEPENQEPLRELYEGSTWFKKLEILALMNEVAEHPYTDLTLSINNILSKPS